MFSVMPRLLGSFFALATVMCVVAGWSLLETGPIAAAIWSFKAEAYRHLLTMGPKIGFGFLLLAIVMGITTAGCFGAKRWGWRLALILIGVNGLADAARAATGETLEGVVGLVIAGGVVLFLMQARVRQAFEG